MKNYFLRRIKCYHFNDDDYKNKQIITIVCILDDVGLYLE